MTAPRRKWATWILAAAVASVIAISVGTFFYINVMREDTPERLGTGNSISPDNASGPLTDISGKWTAAADSQVGYRVKEVLFGQSTEGVGRTNKVNGFLEIDGMKVSAVDLSVDMASITSDESRRDGQFRGRIMDTARHPTATFRLTQPIDLPKVPDSTSFTVKATGDLTLRGTTKTVNVDLTIQYVTGQVQVSGTIPVIFADWNIPNPSFGPAQTEDHGELELLVKFAKG